MAKATCNCLVFLLMILSHELLFVEGRSLELKANSTTTLLSPDAKSVNAVAPKKEVASPSHYHHPMRSMEESVDSFRPTTPGHSPGIGHNIHN
ncbi:hypothetical protein SLA2020_132370 [Shorea laevis]